MVCSVGTGTVAEYYLSEQADYYTGGKEPKGQWFAKAPAFGLEDGGAVEAETFRTLHAGLSPDGSPLGQDNQGLKSARVGGYDLTFSAPKSVSVLWAVSDEDVRTAIEAAQEKATRAALGVLSKNASYCRRGKAGAILEAVEFIGATFQHGEARPVAREDGSVASDHQLHTHSVIFNIAEREDGSRGALDGRHFYKWKMAAGAMYRAQLAHELREALGVQIEVKKDGLFEVEGISKTIRDHFSSRRDEIKTDLAARGLKSKDAQALASAVAKSSRRTKTMGDETAESRHVRWQREAEEQGLTSEEVAACINNPAEDAPSKTFTDQLSEIPSQLTENEAVFRLETLYRAAAKAALETGTAISDIDSAITNLLTSSQVVEIGADELGIPMYSTQEMIEIENELVAVAQRGGASMRHQLSQISVHARLQSSNLTSEQRLAVEFVTTGADIAVMEGSAGAGKTHALQTVADAYKGRGYRVIGTSTAWRMANQLGDDLGIESKATDAWLALEKVGKPFLDSKTVLVVDEAGQLSSRQMLKVLQAAEKAGAKVVLTGDQRQLQAIGAGPGLRLVSEQTGVARIDTIIRQREAWARKAVEDLSLVRADKAIAAFEQRGALNWCADGKEAVKRAVSDWKEFKSSNPDKTALVMAKTNKQVRALNMEMRDHLRATGRLRGEDHVIAAADASGRGYQLPLAVGDQIMFKKRVDKLGVINGTTGMISSIKPDPTGAKLTVNVQGRQIEFNVGDIADDKGKDFLAHGYSATVYSAQGVTVDSSYVVADHTMKRNEIYVAASRARGGCNIYVDSDVLAKVVRSQMPLSDTSRSLVSKENLRERLSACWAEAQSKKSTMDFKPSNLSKPERQWDRSTQGPAKVKARATLPRVEFDR